MLMNMENADYGRYQDRLGQYNTDRSFNYGTFSDDRNLNYGIYTDDRNYNYQMGRDEIADKRYEDETAYNRNIYQQETEYQRKLRMADTMAANGDFSGYKALGYSDDQIKNMKADYNLKLAAQLRTSKGSSSGGSSGGSGGSKKSLTYSQALKLLEDGVDSEEARRVYQEYTGVPWGGENDGEIDSTVLNQHGDSWVHVPGLGRLSYQELREYVNSGKVIEKEDGNTLYYYIAK